MLVLIYEDFRRDNEAVVRQVLASSGSIGRPDRSGRDEKLEAVRSLRLHQLRRAISGRLHPGAEGRLARTIDAIARAAESDRSRPRSVASPIRQQQAPDEQLMAELRRRYKHEVVALSEYLDRDLVALWGYDRIS